MDLPNNDVTYQPSGESTPNRGGGKGEGEGQSCGNE